MVMQKGIAFEQVVAEIQRRIDPNATVVHNERLIDRHGHRRQFDVVIKGKFAGQQLLGIIECKDLRRKIGNPEVDAFVTKVQDVNANFKILVSRKGFSRPAIEKCKHYGIQTLSLIPNDDVNHGFKVGGFWYANIFYWDEITLTLLFVDETSKLILFNAQDVTVCGKRVIDWFTNYLLSEHAGEMTLGWVVGVRTDFKQDQIVELGGNQTMLSRGIEFHAKRACMKKQKFVGINGTGFFDWQQSEITLPAQKSIRTDVVPTNCLEWDDLDHVEVNGGFFTVRLLCQSAQFEYVADAIDLTVL